MYAGYRSLTVAITPTAYASFRDWNRNTEIADAAEKLYGNIDHLELYVGLQAEDAKPVMPGAGLCPGMYHFTFEAFDVLTLECRIHYQPSYP